MMLAADGLKQHWCVRCGEGFIMALVVPVEGDYVCMGCHRVAVAADDVGILVVWSEAEGLS